jgi:hypothetical protein
LILLVDLKEQQHRRVSVPQDLDEAPSIDPRPAEPALVTLPERRLQPRRRRTFCPLTLPTIARSWGMYTTNVTHFAGTDFRNTNQIFGVKDVPHRQDGHRKSTLIETMVLQDIRRGRGVALIDPHADLVERVVAQVPPQRAAHVIYLNAADPSQPHG